MKVLKKYRLELWWDGVEYIEDRIVKLHGAYFTGPVLKDAARINPNDKLVLDMTSQYKLFVPDYYQADLEWGEVVYKGENVLLKDAVIKGKYVNSIETLSDTDFILIDCGDHEEASHPYNLVYWSEVCKKEGGDKFGG